MDVSSKGAGRMNLFALVVYISDPLAKFLDDLRKELVPGCVPHAHVTILPPRPLGQGVRAAIEQAQSIVSEFAPFEIVAGEVEIFAETDVIHIGIKEGDRELREMYRALNRGALAFKEPFPYHPHITLAQGLAAGAATPLYEIARKKWAACKFSKRIRAEHASFVQATTLQTWVDLADFRLAGVPVR
jgi:2'-5' RNA ligase